MNFRRPVPKKDQPSKADKRSDADALVAAFLAKGGAIKEMPSVEATAFSVQDLRPRRDCRHGAGKTHPPPEMPRVSVTVTEFH